MAVLFNRYEPSADPAPGVAVVTVCCGVRICRMNFAKKRYRNNRPLELPFFPKVGCMTIMRAAAFIRIAPFTLFALILMAERPLADLLSEVGVDLRGLYAAMSGLVVLVLALFWRGYSELIPPAEVSVKTWFVAMGVGLLVFSLWTLPYPDWARFGAHEAGDVACQQRGEVDYALLAICISVTRNLWAPVAAHVVTNGTLGLWVVFTDAWEFW